MPSKNRALVHSWAPVETATAAPGELRVTGRALRIDDPAVNVDLVSEVVVNGVRFVPVRP